MTPQSLGSQAVASLGAGVNGRQVASSAIVGWVGRAKGGIHITMRSFLKCVSPQPQRDGRGKGFLRSRAAVTAALAVAILVASYFLLLTWRVDPPLLDGDDAVYVLMADFFSPFSDRDKEVLALVMRRSYFPPLYPMLLGLLGGVASSTLLAHAVSVATLFLAFIALFVWANSIIERPITVAVLVILVALLPATVVPLFGLLSEGLYLVLTLVALFLAVRGPRSKYWHYLTALVIGLAILSRTVGFALWLAYAIWLISGRREHWRTLPLIALIPWFAWTVWKSTHGYAASYAGSVMDLLSGRTLWRVIVEQLSVAPVHIWHGWASSINHLEISSVGIGAAILGAICIAGLARRLYLGSLDGLYVAVYLGTILVWPYSYEARRLLFVVLPLLLVQGLAMAEWVGSRTTNPVSVRRRAATAYLAILGVTALPAILLMQERLIAGFHDSNRRYAVAASWYTYPNVNRAKERIGEEVALARAWQASRSKVSAGECVYHPKPVAFMLYANRRAYATPYAGNASEFWEKATLCHDFYLGAFVYPPYREPFYPRRFLGPDTRVLSIDYLEEGARRRPLGMLIRVERRPDTN